MEEAVEREVFSHAVTATDLQNEMEAVQSAWKFQKVSQLSLGKFFSPWENVFDFVVGPTQPRPLFPVLPILVLLLS